MIIHNIFFYLKNLTNVELLKKWVSEYKNGSGLVGEGSYFIGNILVQVRHGFLGDYHLILSLLESKGVGVFCNKKNLVQTEAP